VCGGRAVVRACVRAAIFVCPRSYFYIRSPIFFKLSTNVGDYKITAKFDNLKNRLHNSRVTALDLQILLDKLLV